MTLIQLKKICQQTQWQRFFIGIGYHVYSRPFAYFRILLENPGWSYAYTTLTTRKYHKVVGSKCLTIKGHHRSNRHGISNASS